MFKKEALIVVIGVNVDCVTMDVLDDVDAIY